MGIVYAIIAAVMVFIGGVGYSLVTGYGGQATKLSELTHQNDLMEKRLTSYKRMIDRRDAAIEASVCKVRIKYLISHPDEIPAKFAPFDTRTGN